MRHAVFGLPAMASPLTGAGSAPALGDPLPPPSTVTARQVPAGLTVAARPSTDGCTRDRSHIWST